jgi:hypothetical protein
MGWARSLSRSGRKTASSFLKAWPPGDSLQSFSGFSLHLSLGAVLFLFSPRIQETPFPSPPPEELRPLWGNPEIVILDLRKDRN